jgi:hypothetical protein
MQFWLLFDLNEPDRVMELAMTSQGTFAWSATAINQLVIRILLSL